MIENSIGDEYFDWMYETVCNDKYSRNISYRKLFQQLHDTDFVYILPMDESRWEDGVDLRYRFGRDRGYDDRIIATQLDRYPCSVLEMMIALSIRCEEHIMGNHDVGNRVGQWFWEMIVSLDLGHMTDKNYDPDYVDRVMDIFLNREYDRNGKGGLFTVDNPAGDMRNTEIWYQMHWHLNECVDDDYE